MNWLRPRNFNENKRPHLNNMKTMSNYKFMIALSSLMLMSTISYTQETNPYNPEPLMKELKEEKGKKQTKMHFLVFGDSKGSKYFPDVLKRADSLKPDFCITTADLVNRGGGANGKIDYEKLDAMGGWFMRKYPMWPTVGNHEEAGGDDSIENFSNFFGMKKVMYSFTYGNAKFIALPWPKVNDDPKKIKMVEKGIEKGQRETYFCLPAQTSLYGWVQTLYRC